MAHDLGKLLAQKGVGIIYGGGGTGLMGAVADGSLQNGGNVWGVIPEQLIQLEMAHPGLTDLTVVSTMHERKKIMYDMSDGFLALPGGLGTMDEFCEILTWAQLKYHSKPCWILNYNGFYDHLLEHFKGINQEGFLSNEFYKLIRTQITPKKLVQDCLASL